ncbi:hypothetical protein [Curtobacterium sp. ISL-83]|uniref:hypothetical protein n=1 Tax=Curtobacterium sp. ISL-83 TaxID=2819145 RepID=UPI001BE621F1|nr:hypothetical protein [Curtobacterium sp. ISL-83]MBT2504020.1 hypothetical protein [Curtobacterium sp. ISL-83]
MGNENGRNRRRGGTITAVIVVGYLALRLGLLAWREHESGMSTGGIVLSVIGFAALVVVVAEATLAVHHARTRRREAALIVQHPTAHLVPVLVHKDLGQQLRHAAGVLGQALPDVPRRGYATLVADGHGIGLYTGGAEPRLLLGVPRPAVQAVADGETSAAGRYAFGKVDALRVLVGTGAPVAVDFPVYRTVLGFPKTLRGEELAERVRAVAGSAGVPVATG